ncbi:MAG: hypothetical protein ACK4NB_02975, partial [Fimbriimonadales bacterium]
MRRIGWLVVGLAILSAFLHAQAKLPSDLEARYQRALRLAAQGKYQQAEPLLREIVQREPN